MSGPEKTTPATVAAVRADGEKTFDEHCAALPAASRAEERAPGAVLTLWLPGEAMAAQLRTMARRYGYVLTWCANAAGGGVVWYARPEGGAVERWGGVPEVLRRFGPASPLVLRQAARPVLGARGKRLKPPAGPAPRIGVGA
jgi:hypothetical protein